MLVTYNGFKIDLPYDILQVEYMALEERVNEHIHLDLKVLVEEDKVLEYINQPVTGTKVIVKEYNRHINREVPIFQGKITNVTIHYHGQLHILELSCISFTHDFDIKKNNRTFCDLDLTYKEVIKNVLSLYPKKDFQDMVTKNQKINHFLLQYEETDWEFIKRLATHFEALLLPDAAASFGRMYFGLPKLNNNVEIHKDDYSILKDLEKYKKDKIKSKEKIMTQDYTSWEIETDIRLYLGEEVIFNNVRCQVTRVLIHTYKEDIQYVYRLEIYKGVRSIYTTNPKIFGMSLPAIVKERSGNRVRVHFEIDDAYIKKPNNKYFTYALESSAWYCMPVEESKVHIYFPTNNEKDAIATHAIRIAGSNEKYYHKAINPDHKSFSNTTGSEMKMTPKDISFAVDDAKSISLMLKKSGDINIKGDNITLKAANNINFGVRELPPDVEGEPLRPKNITMSAKESFIITRNEDSNHSINIIEETHLIASFIKIYGTVNNPPSIPASAYDQSANDGQLIDQHNAGAKQALVNKMNDAKSKVGFGTIAIAIGGAALFAAATVLTGGAAIAVAVAAGSTAIAVGASEISEGRQDYTKAQSGDLSESDNCIYNMIKYGSVGVGAFGGICNSIETSLDTMISSTISKLSEGFELDKIMGCIGFPGEKLVKGFVNSMRNIAKTKVDYLERNLSSGVVSGLESVMKKLFAKPSNCEYDGDPVNIATGSLYVPATDLVLPDMKSEFKIERKYNSVNKRVGILGKGWTFNYESNLQVENDRAIILCTDGHIETFYKKDEVWENHKGSSNNYRLDFDSWKNEYRFKDISKNLIYVYNENGQLIKIIDKNNNEMIITYKGSSIHTLKTFSNYMLDFICENGKIVQIKDEIGRTVQYKYDGDYLTHVVHVDYGITKYEYDEKGYIKAITDQNGNIYTINEFDQEGRVTYQKYSTGDTCTITYDDENRETQFYFSESKRSKKYKYNRDYLVTHIYYEDGTYEEYDYDEYQNKIFEKDRNDQITKREYNRYGNIVKEELPNGLIIYYHYDENQNLIKKSDNNGREQLYKYNLQGNTIEQRNKIAVGVWQKEKYEYDIYGRVIKRTDPLGNSKTFDYEINDKILPEPSRIKDSEENIYEYTYDKVGRNESIKTKYGEVEFGYNRLNYITYIKDAKGNVTRKYYDKMGNLIRFVSPNNYNADFDNGEAYEYKYDSMDRLIQIKDPLGNVLKNIRDTEGNIIKEINPNDYDFSTQNGIGIEYEYDKDNRKIKTIYPDGGVERFFYDSEENIIKHVTPEYYDIDLDDGLGYSYQYDSMNRLIVIIDPKGEVEKKYQYDLYGNITHEIDKEGNTTLFKYDLLGNILEKREPIDQVGEEAKYKITVYEYNKNGNKIKEKYGKESVGKKDYPQYYHEIFFTYDKNNRLIRVKDKHGAKVEYRYDCLNNKIYESFKINDHTDKTIHYIYDEAGQLIEKKEEINGDDLSENIKGKSTWAITKYNYDKNGNIIHIKTPKGYEISRIYDKIDRVIEEYQKDKENGIYRKYAYTYDQSNNLIKVTDHSNPKETTTKEYIYDSKNRVTHYMNELGNTTRIFYDKNDRIIKEVLPEQYKEELDDGAGTTYQYNLKGQVEEVRNPLGEMITKNEYDYKGNIISSIDGINNKVEYTYNLLGQIKDIITPNSKKENKAIQSYTYDVRGNITGICDGNGNSTIYKLDDWGRIEEIINPEGGVEKYTYDYAGNITSTTDPNRNIITYLYNSFNKVCEIKDQEGHSEYFYYDTEGNQVEHIDRNENKVFYGYNIDNNITFRKGHDKNGEHRLYESFKYNEDGTLKLAKANHTAYSYTYTKDRRLKSKQVSGKTFLNYEYDKNNNIKSIKDITEKSTKYIYDPANRVKEILDDQNRRLATYNYDPNNNIKGIHYGNGITTNYTYDKDQNIASLITKISKGEILVDYHYDYDLNGNSLQKVGSKHQTYYTYDSLNRLTNAKYDKR